MRAVCSASRDPYSCHFKRLEAQKELQLHFRVYLYLWRLGLGAMVSIFHQKWQVGGSNSGISLSTKIGNKSACLPLPYPAKVKALCTGMTCIYLSILRALKKTHLFLLLELLHARNRGIVKIEVQVSIQTSFITMTDNQHDPFFPREMSSSQKQ